MRRAIISSLACAIVLGLAAGSSAQTATIQDAVNLNLQALAAGAAPPATPARQADQLDYAFFASDRPVLIRLHLRIGDRPYDAAWNDWMAKLFAWFDKNGNGVLEANEVARLPHSQTLQFQLQGSIGANTQA